MTGAGIAEITNQLEYDDEVAYHAGRKLYDLARGHSSKPWCLTVSFTHPHDPYVARRKHWDLYDECDELAPRIGEIAFDEQDRHSQRLLESCDSTNFKISHEDIRRSRRAYFANISYIDEKIGELLDVLDRCRMTQNTVVLFLSDHGDMLGARGLWFKMNFFEGSARVPLMIAGPGIAPRLVKTPVSTLDVAPTLARLAGIDLAEIKPWTDGFDLSCLSMGAERPDAVFMEYAAEGSVAPLVAIRQGRWKFVHCEVDPPQLFDLAADPDELTNLAADPAHAETVEAFLKQVRQRWDMERFDAEVRESQARRCVVYEALRNGAYFPWDYQPLQRASERYMRNHMDLNILEESQRYPRGE